MRSFPLVAILSLMTAAAAEASLIDTFDCTDQIVGARTGSGMGLTSVQANLPCVIGNGTRTLTLSNVTGINSLRGVVAGVDTMLGSLLWSNDTGVTSRFTVTWDNFGARDLTDGGTSDVFELEVLALDLNVNLTFKVFDGTNTSTLSAINSPLGSNHFAISAFAGAANFAAVQRIQLEISSVTPAVDGEFDFLGTTSSTPEPGTVVLLVSALAGLAWASGRAKCLRFAVRVSRDS